MRPQKKDYITGSGVKLERARLVEDKSGGLILIGSNVKGSEAMTETKKITYIEAVGVFRPGLINKESSFKQEELDILKERDGVAVLDADYFPTVQIDGRDTMARANLNKPSITFNLDCRIWGTSVTYRLYTDKKKKPQAIRREIEKERDRRYGALFAVDLSFIR